MNFLPETAGTYKVSIALNQDGSNVIGTSQVEVSEMPKASLTITASADNVRNGVLQGDDLTIDVAISNVLASAYDEDIHVTLYRLQRGNSGWPAYEQSQPVTIAAHKKATLSFTFPDLIVGERYFASIFYYSEGSAVLAKQVGIYTIGGNTYAVGDVDGNGSVDGGDINKIINIILGGDLASNYDGRADVNGDGSVDGSDINAIINMILGH